MSFERILVAMDFSPASHAALRRARAIAAKDGRLILLHVVGADLTPYGPTAALLTQQAMDGASAELNRLAGDPRGAGLAVEVLVAVGRPADEVLKAAASTGATMIVCGAHARGLVGRIVLGSVSEEIARRSTIPTFVVRELTKGGDAATVERVVVALDHDWPSRVAARTASALAVRLGVPLEGIHVIELPTLPTYARGALPIAAGDLTPELVSQVRCSIADEVAKAVGHEVKTRFLSGRPAREIVRCTRPTDVLVCGTHGRSGLGSLAFGSVATKLLRRAPCPVLVVRPGDAS